jgi:uncharacterized protein (DUF1684 family)
MHTIKILSLLVICSFSVSMLAQTGKAYKKTIKRYRKGHIKELVTSERGPINKKEAKKLNFFDIDEGFKVVAQFDLTPDAEPFDMATYSGQTRQYIKYGTLTFALNGEEHQLAIYQSLRLRNIPQYKDYLFLPFKDFTNGETSYGGGRYLDFEKDDIQKGQLLIDFNKAYNPYCAYSDGYSCAVPPKENHLQTAIEAGEKDYEKMGK